MARRRAEKTRLDQARHRRRPAEFFVRAAMKTFIVMASIGLALSGVAMSARPASAQERFAQMTSKEMCAQVISCGTKDGKAKEYPTPCAARDDGATNIHPKTGPACDGSK
jgi:hypothetical protein